MLDTYSCSSSARYSTSVSVLRISWYKVSSMMTISCAINGGNVNTSLNFGFTVYLWNKRCISCHLRLKLVIFQCMDKIFCVKFQRNPLKIHSKYLSHTWKETFFIQYWKFNRFQIYELVNFFLNAPRPLWLSWLLMNCPWPDDVTRNDRRISEKF